MLLLLVLPLLLLLFRFYYYYYYLLFLFFITVIESLGQELYLASAGQILNNLIWSNYQNFSARYQIPQAGLTEGLRVRFLGLGSWVVGQASTQQRVRPV